MNRACTVLTYVFAGLTLAMLVGSVVMLVGAH